MREPRLCAASPSPYVMREGPNEVCAMLSPPQRTFPIDRWLVIAALMGLLGLALWAAYRQWILRRAGLGLDIDGVRRLSLDPGRRRPDGAHLLQQPQRLRRAP